MVREAYEEWKKKYQLPDYDELNYEFEISTLEPDEFLLRGIKKKLQDKLEMISDFLGQLLSPNPDSLGDMHECRYITEDQKEVAFNLYKQLQFLFRALNESTLINDEQKDVELINKIVEEWKIIKEKTLPLLAAMKDSWKGDIDYKEELAAYFG